MLSHGAAGGDCGIVEHGQASPIDIPSTWVRVDGQMLDKPSISTDQSVGRAIIGTWDALVDG